MTTFQRAAVVVDTLTLSPIDLYHATCADAGGEADAGFMARLKPVDIAVGKFKCKVNSNRYMT